MSDWFLAEGYVKTYTDADGVERAEFVAKKLGRDAAWTAACGVPCILLTCFSTARRLSECVKSMDDPARRRTVGHETLPVLIVPRTSGRP
ncbi:MAG: hypothetical protein ACTHZ9_04795 [Leucobacter sp.]